MIGNFYIDLYQTINNNIYNSYTDNYDHLRFGIDNNKIKKPTLRKWIVRQLNKRGYFSSHYLTTANQALENSLFIDDFAYLYNLLKDNYSKELLVKIAAYRILGKDKVKLPLNTAQYWKDIERIEENQKSDDYLQIKSMDFKLFYNDLFYLDLPIKIYFPTAGVLVDFIVKQYDLVREGLNIAVSPGDIIIDGGGCYADTALYFAYKTGPGGMVHSFEFIPDNLDIWHKNVSMNPSLSESVSLIQHPIWSDSDINVYYKSNGPGSTVSFEKFKGFDGVVKTISLDDYANKNKLQKVDFIKLDVEGSELAALEGAIEILKSFKPKLAVALYHNTKDFYTIPKFLHELNLGYEFYLSHATIHEEETMLFAIVK
jgi:FkbM family methyltransferase